MPPDSPKAPQDGSKHCCITPTPASLPDVPLISSYTLVMVLELFIQDEAYPECVNRPGGGKDDLCHLCSFQHTNYDCMLTHIQKDLNITIGCPSCGQGFKNAASLCKHRKKVHQIQIMASAEEQ